MTLLKHYIIFLSYSELKNIYIDIRFYLYNNLDNPSLSKLYNDIKMNLSLVEDNPYSKYMGFKEKSKFFLELTQDQIISIYELIDDMILHTKVPISKQFSLFYDLLFTPYTEIKGFH